MDTNELIPLVEPIPEDNSLVRRASSGEVDAFIQLFEAYGDDLYRYVYFRVLSDVAAEAITSQVFRHAWDNLDRGRKKGTPFVVWLYELARTQIIAYYTMNLRTREFDLATLLTAADYRLDQEIPDWSHMEAWGNHLRLLTGDVEQSRLQSTAALIMRRYLDYLNPGSRSRPSPTFNSYTRAWLIRYMHFHPRGGGHAMMTARPRPHFRPTMSMVGRIAMATATLALALVITGTAQAQSALPGDPLYAWKRTSEQAMLSLSPDPVGTELFLADRRLDELIKVEKDPRRSASALDSYYQALSALSESTDAQTRDRIMPVLQVHRKKIVQSGIASPQLERYLAAAVTVVPQTEVTAQAATAPAPTVAAFSTSVAPTQSSSTFASSPTEAMPTPTAVPPTATPVPTEIPPTATPIPTDVPTDIPTEIPPTATPMPAEVVPTATDAQPAPTSIDLVPTDQTTGQVPTAMPTFGAQDSASATGTTP